MGADFFPGAKPLSLSSLSFSFVRAGGLAGVAREKEKDKDKEERERFRERSGTALLWPSGQVYWVGLGLRTGRVGYAHAEHGRPEAGRYPLRLLARMLNLFLVPLYLSLSSGPQAGGCRTGERLRERGKRKIRARTRPVYWVGPGVPGGPRWPCARRNGRPEAGRYPQT